MKRVTARAVFKRLAHAISVAIVSPAALICWLEHARSSEAEGAFAFFAHCFALLPGLPGMYLRRAFFRLTLDACSSDYYVGFGSFFTHRQVTVEDRVYIGHYSLIGCAVLRAGCLIGSQASLLSRPALHEWDDEAGWLPSEVRNLRPIEIGEASWIGERAVVMADVGAGAMIAGGSVVSTAVPPRVMVAGNPARFVRRMGGEAPARVAPRSDDVSTVA